MAGSEGLKIGIAGVSGKMGKAIARLAIQDRKFKVVSGLVSPDSIHAGEDIGKLAGVDNIGVKVTSDISALIRGVDVIIDFTRPEITFAILDQLNKSPKPFVSGTTGFSAEQKKKLEEFSKTIPLLHTANMSMGVNLLAALVEKAAGVLGEDFDIEITEMHHRHKVDAPSGTALMLGEAAAKGRKANFAEKKALNRDGARKSGDIGFAVLRGGDVIGDHSVIFAGSGERIELSHYASSRDIFARGALTAAFWLAGKSADFYTMKDVLST